MCVVHCEHMCCFMTEFIVHATFGSLDTRSAVFVCLIHTSWSAVLQRLFADDALGSWREIYLSIVHG